MHEPPLVGWLLVVLSTGTGTLCMLRARAEIPTGQCARRTAYAEGVMGLGMALMAVPATALDEAGWGPPLFIAVFAALALRSLAFARGECHRAHHALEAAAMVYMAAVMTGGADSMAMGAMTGMGHRAMGLPAVNAVLLCYFAGSALWTGSRMLAQPAPAALPSPHGGGAGILQAPEVAAACRLSMTTGMLVMLVIM